jgi:hypothetical protein
MAIPGLYRVVQVLSLSLSLYFCVLYYKFVIKIDTCRALIDLQEIIKTQVARMYLWPKVLEVPIMDLSK